MTLLILTSGLTLEYLCAENMLFIICERNSEVGVHMDLEIAVCPFQFYDLWPRF